MTGGEYRSRSSPGSRPRHASRAPDGDTVPLPKIAVSGRSQPPATSAPDEYPLANDLYLIAHDAGSGARRLSRSATGLASAGALLCELALTNHVQVADTGRLIAVPNRVAPVDELGMTLTEEVAREKPAHVGDWITYLGMRAEDEVRDRLVRGRCLAAETPRWLRRSPKYMPTVRANAPWREARLFAMATGRIPMALPDRVLLGLVRASGLLGAVMADAQWAHRRRCGDVVHALPDTVRVFVVATEAAVAQAAAPR